MDRKLIVFLVLVVVVLTAAALLVTSSRYSGPQGAATGESGGCGGGPVDEGFDMMTDDDVVFAPQAEFTPAQVIYHTLIDGQICGRVTIEPEDHLATFDDLCNTDVPPVVLDLEEAAAKEILQATLALAKTPCDESQCPPGTRVEILTQAEETILVPFASPLRERVETILEQVDDAPLAAPAAPATVSQVITLAPETGAVFGSGQVLNEASPLKVDLICYASSKSVDMQAGAGPTMAKQKHLKLFRTPGGTTAKFASLAEVPDENPTESDRDMVHHAQPGNAFVVENNISGGHAKVLVKEADTAHVVLEYILIP